MLATEPLRERLYERPHYARGGYDYWQQLPDGRLVLGGKRDASLETEKTDVVETTVAIQAALDAFLDRARRLPAVGHRPLGRHLGHHPRSAAARRAGAGP